MCRHTHHTGTHRPVLAYSNTTTLLHIPILMLHVHYAMFTSCSCLTSTHMRHRYVCTSNSMSICVRCMSQDFALRFDHHTIHTAETISKNVSQQKHTVDWYPHRPIHLSYAYKLICDKNRDKQTSTHGNCVSNSCQSITGRARDWCGLYLAQHEVWRYRFPLG
jgi:hypothetical protein